MKTGSVLALALIASVSALARPAPSPVLARRIAAGDCEVYGLVCWGLNTYTDKEWGFGDEDPKLLDPKAFDADQIVGACKAGGLQGLIFVAKHHDGFCLWPTKTTEYNISKSPFRDGKGDYVREMERACRKAGLKFGIYVSPWDRNSAAYGTGEYVDLYHDQVRELLVRTARTDSGETDTEKWMKAAGAERAPTLGWASWNAFGVDVSEDIILAQAEAMATNGLKAAGYNYVNIDDGAFHGRDAQGSVRPNERRFPSGFSSLTKSIHDLGLKAGTYSDAGEGTCAGLYNGDKRGLGTGFYGHEDSDARQRFLDWGFDFVKIDFCGGAKLGLKPCEQYARIRRAVDATGRADVILNICCWRYDGAWMRDVGDSWRVTGDVRANWRSIRSIVDQSMYLSPYGGFGHYNDMDMLQVGRYVGQTKQARFAEFKSDTGLTAEEEQTHFGLWCIFESPLLIGCDLRDLPASTLKLVTNPELLAMNQSEPHEQAYVAKANGDGTYVFVKDADRRFGPSRFVALYNRSDEVRKMKLAFADVDLGGRVIVRDLVRRRDVGSVESLYEIEIPPHGTRFCKLTAERRLDRRVYEAELAFLNEFRAGANYEKLEFASRARNGRASGGYNVRFLGKRRSNYLEWRDVYISKSGTYRLSFDYVSCGDRAVDVQIDGGKLMTLETPASRQTVSMAAELGTGCHRVRLSCEGVWAADFDRLVITPDATR